MYSPGTNAVDKKQAESVLLEYQSSPNAWSMSISFLGRHDSTVLQFFGAQTLYSKVMNSWNTLPVELQSAMRDRLLVFLSQKGSSTPWFVVAKICQVFVSFVIRERLHESADALYIVVQQLVSVDIKSCLELLTLLPVEAAKFQWEPQIKNQMDISIQNLSADVIRFTTSMLQDANHNSSALTCLSGWIQHRCVSVDSTLAVLNVLLNLFVESDHGALERLCDVLIDIFNDSRLHKCSDSVCAVSLSVLTSSSIHSRYTTAISSSNADVVRPICKVVSELGEQFVSYFANHMLDQQVMVAIDMLLACSEYPGYYGAEQEESELAFNFWFLFEEYARLEIDEDSAIKAQRHAIFLRLLQALCIQCRLPPESLWKDWNSDTKDVFRGHRREVAETLLYCYYSLSEKALEMVVAALLSKLQLLFDTNDSSLLQDIEACLFCVKEFAEAVPSSESVYMPQVINSEILGSIHSISQSYESLHRIRSTTCYLLDNYAEWLSKHPDTLPAVFEFIFASLPFSSSTMFAVNAMCHICNFSRSSLTPYADEILNACVSVLPSVQPSIREKIYKSMTMVIQALPGNASRQRLNIMFKGILDEINVITTQAKLKPSLEESKQTLLSQIGYLKSCCRGVKPIETEGVITIDDDPVLVATQDEQDIGRYLFELAKRMIETWCQASDVIDACATLLTDLSRSKLPYLQVAFSDFVHLMLWCNTQNSSLYILDCLVDICSYLPDERIQTKVFHTTAELFNQNLQFSQFIDDHPDVVDSYISFVRYFMEKHARIIMDLDEEFRTSVFATLVIQCLKIKEHLVVIKTLLFVKEFIEQSHESSVLQPLVNRVLNSVGLEMTRSFIDAIGGGLSRSMLNYVAQPLFLLVTKYPNETKHMLAINLQTDGFPSNRVGMDAKVQFINKLMATRKLKTFNEVIRQFSGECRGF